MGGACWSNMIAHQYENEATANPKQKSQQNGKKILDFPSRKSFTQRMDPWERTGMVAFRNNGLKVRIYIKGQSIVPKRGRRAKLMAMRAGIPYSSR